MTHKLLLIHGAFQGGFVWKPLLPRLATFDYEVLTPTLDGRCLSDHIQQISELISAGSSNQRFTVVGHSYGSLVATGVVQGLADKINGLIFLDAPLPYDPVAHPQSLLDILGEEARQFFMARTNGGMVQTFPAASFGLNEETHADMIAQHRDQALPCFTEKGPSWSLDNSPAYPVSYIQCKPNPFTTDQVSKARLLNWDVYTIPESGHCPMITHPGALCKLLHESIMPKIEADELKQNHHEDRSRYVRTSY